MDTTPSKRLKASSRAERLRTASSTTDQSSSNHDQTAYQTPDPRDINSGFWMLTNYRDPNYLKLPRRVNHATAIYKDKIYLLGGYHKLSPYLDYDSMPSKLMSLDCYEYDCLTQKCTLVKDCRELTEEDMVFRSASGSQADLTEPNRIERDDCYPRELPLLRYGLRACAMNDKIYISGGISDYERAKETSSLVNFADVFELDMKTWKYKNLTKMQPRDLALDEITASSDIDLDVHLNGLERGDRQPSPGVRDGHSLAEIPRLNCFIIYAGYAYVKEDLLQDLWLFDCSKNEWHLLDVKHQFNHDNMDNMFTWCNKTPFPRDFSDLQVVGDDLLMYGGRTYQFDSQARKWNDVYDEDIWIIEGLFKNRSIAEIVKTAPNFQWKKAHVDQKKSGGLSSLPYQIPTPRRSQMSFIRNGDFYLIGGVDANKKHHPDIWKFSLRDRFWTKIVNLSRHRKQPASRRRGSTLYLPGLDWLVMICGTRPASVQEKEMMAEKKKSPELDKNDEDGECLMEVDDLNIFLFGDSLRHRCLDRIMGNVNLRTYDCREKLEVVTDIGQALGTQKSIELINGMKRTGLGLFSKQFFYLTAANQRNEMEEVSPKRTEAMSGRGMKKSANG